MSEVTKELAIELQVDGESAYAVESVPALVPIETDDTGSVTDHTNKSITIYGRKGANARAAATITNYTLPTGFTFVSNNNGVLTFKAGSQASLATSANVEITATYDGLTFGMLIPLVPAKQGEAGTDADDTEWIYKYDADGYAGTAGEVNPSGAASGNDTNKQQKGWVPENWYNHALAISGSNPTVYASYRTLNGATGQWGAFQTPIEWSHWGRNGQDGDGTEYVFIRTQNNVPPVMDSTQTGYSAAKFCPTITSASRTASGTEQAQTTDNPKGANDTYPFEWCAKRTMTSPDSSGARTWDKFKGENNDYKMSLWSNLGQDGNGIVSVTRTFAISNVGTTASETTEPSHQGSWTTGSPAVTSQYPYLWAKEVTVFTDTTKNTTKYYCIGARGDNGVDAKDVEWAYIRTTTPTAPTILNDNTYTDSNSKTYTADGHLPRVDATNRTDIEKENSGSSSKYYECTDDPKGVNDTWKYEWEIKRTKGNVGADGSRAWNYYAGEMTLHNNYAESAFIIDIDNDNDQFGTDSDSKVQVEQTRSTTVTLYDGATPQTLKSLAVSLKYENGTTNVPTSVATYTADKDTGKVDVTVKVNNTSNSHTEIQAHITATDTNDRQKSVVFTLYKVMGGAPGLTPIIYNIAATDKVFSFQRTDSNALTPSSRTSQINVARTEGNTTTILDTAQTGLTFSWGFDDETTAQATGQSIGDSIEVTNTQATSHSSVWVELSSGDRETLAIVKDGAKGGKGDPGTNGETPAFLFKWETSVNAPTVTAPNYVAGTNLGGWSKSAPNKVEGKKLWMSQNILVLSGSTYSWKNNQAWSTPVCISGEDGDPGADAKDREWIYIRQTTYPFSGTAPASITKDTSGTTRSAEYIATHDDFVPQGWSDNALPATDSEKYVYTSWRDYDTSTEQWGAFQTPILWSNWGVQGMDGDGVQYIYKLFDHELTDAERTSNIPTKPSQQNSSGEWLPISGDSNWYDDPQAPTSSMKFCYCSIIKRINGVWGSYEKLGLWSKWSEDGTNGETPAFLFKWETSVDAPTVTAPNYVAGTNLGGWSKSAPNKVEGKKLWMSQNILVLSGSTYSWKNNQAWSTPVCISGEDGDPGADAKDREWIYIRQTTYPFSGTAPASITKDTSGTTRSAEYIATHDDFVPQGWSDNALPATDSEKYVYTSWRDYDTSTEQWGAFQTPILWSNWGVQGMDGDGVQYIYKLFDHELTDAERTSNIPTKPSSMTDGEWIPSGWSDDPLAPTSLLPYCYCSTIKKTGGSWASTFDKLGLWSKWAEDGTNGETPAFLFKWETSVNAPTVTAPNYVAGTNLGGWSKTAPNKVEGKKLWMSQNVLVLSGSTYSWKNNNPWSTPVCISGEDGDPGADAKEREWIYQRSNTGVTPDTPTNPQDRTVDDYVPTGWSDNALAIAEDNKYVYASWRDYDTSTELWGDFQPPILWSNWGVQGIDGDGVQYVYKLFNHELNDSERTSNIPTKPSSMTDGEWIPSGWSDDPLAPTSLLPYCYCSTIKKVGGSWASTFDKLGLWSKWADDGIIADLDNEMDAVSVDKFGCIPQLSLTEGGITYAAKVQTTAKLFKGSAPQSFTLKVYDEGGTEYTNNGSYRNGIKVVYTSGSQTSNLIKVYFQSAASVGDKKVFTITLNSTYSVQFTVKGVQGDVYQLLPNIDEVVFGVDGTTNEWTPTTGVDVYCGYTRNVGGTITEYVGTDRANTCKSNASYTEGGTTKYGTAPYNIFFRYQNADSSWGGWSWNKDKTNGTINIPNSTTYVAIQFVLSSATGTGSITEDKIIDKETLPITKAGKTGASGTSPYFADLDNEMDSVALTYQGKVDGTQAVETNVSMFHGVTPITPNTIEVYDGTESSSNKYTSGTPKGGITVTISGQKITASFANNTDLSSYGKKVFLIKLIDSTDDVTRYLNFTVHLVWRAADGTPATIYNILPSLTEVSVGRNDDNSFAPRYNTLQCGYKKSIGSDITTVTEATGNIDGTYRLFFRRRNRSNQTWESTYYYYNYSTYKRYIVVTSGYSTSGLDVETYDAVEFYIYKNTSSNSLTSLTSANIADKETVSVISDGENGAKGENSIRLALDNEHEDFIYSGSGKVAPSSVLRITPTLYDGLTPIASENVGWQIDTSKSSGTEIKNSGNPTTYLYTGDCAYIGPLGELDVNGLTANTAKIVVKAKYPNDNTGQYYYATFSANKTQQDKYDLVFSDNAIAYNPANYTSQTQKRIKVYADVTNLSGATSHATISTSTSTPSAGTLRLYATYGGNTVQITDTVTENSITKHYLDVTPAIAAANDGIYFELRRYTGSSAYDVVDYETVEIAKVQNGDGGLSIAITPNTMAVNTDASGVTESASQDFAFKVYKGKDEVPVSEYAVTHSSLPNNNWTWTGLYYNAFRIQCANGATFTTPTAITVTVALSSGGSIQTSVLLVPNRKGSDGASPYRIDLTNDMDAIQYADDVMAGSSVTTTAKLYLGTQELTLTTDYTLSYSATGCTASRSGQVITVSALSAERGYVVITATLVADNTKTFSAVFTVMRLQNKDKFYIQTDKQVIPINTDTTSSSTTFPINIKVYRDGINPQSKKVETSLVQTLSNYGLYLWAGAESPRSYVTTYSSGYTYNMSFSETNVHIYITDNATFGSGTILDHEVIPSVRVQNGQQGIQGKMGRTPYYWGKWSEKESTDTFTVNDYMTPYVANGETGGIPQCWIFVGANGSYTKSTAGEPSNSNTKWQLMTSDFEYLITKAIFSDFAQLGSGIFNGDFVFSQEGTIDGWEANTTKAFVNPYTCYYPTSSSIKGRDSVSIKNSLVQVNTTTWTAVSNSFTALKGVPYVISFYFASNPNNYYFTVASSQPLPSTTGWWSSQWNYARPYNWLTEDSLVQVWCRKRDSSQSSVRINDIRLTTFVPNLAWNWKTGEIYSQLGHFVNVTVEGVMNNLIQEITSTNYTDYGVYTSGTNTDAFWLNTAKVGSIIRYKYTKPLGLPSAYANAGEPVETYLCDSGDGTHQMTLNELRQCIGKKIYVLTDGNTGMARIRVGKYFSSSSEEKMLLYNNTWYYAFSSNTTTANWFWVFECKMGERNGRECIYWELLASHNKLPDNLAF